MNLLKKKNERTAERLVSVQTAERGRSGHPFVSLAGYTPFSRAEMGLYASLKEGIPIIDAAIKKLVRLIGRMKIKCGSEAAESALNDFLKSVRVDSTLVGIDNFLSIYFEQLLTYGAAVGEVVLTADGEDIGLLYNAPLENIELRLSENGVDPLIFVRDGGGLRQAENPERLCLTLLNPDPGTLKGNSLLSGLPFVSDILIKIFQSMGSNWERVGNVRFAVTYRPDADGAVYAQENAQLIAKEWTKAMRDSSRTSDFISVGDVDIKVIGADNQVLDSEIPVRQMLEQIVAKLGVPPFLLGLSWSSTERMSAQQVDILTSELEYYRTLLEPVIMKICKIWQGLNGYREKLEIVWDNISLQDETELAQARLLNARAESQEMENAASADRSQDG